jgi:hypothetical protein
MSETADDNAVQEALQAQVDRLFGRIPEEDRTAAEKEAYREIEELAAAAADPTTPPERLTALFDEYIDRVNYPRGHVHFREREKAAREWLGPPLARHPNAPLKVLLELARYHPHDVVANPVFPLLPLEHPDLTEQFGARSLEHLLRCAGCPPAFVRLCADHANPDIRFAAREHIALTGEPDPFGTDWQEAALDGLMALRMSLPDDVYDLWETGWLPEPIAARFPTVPEPQLPEEFGLMERRIQKFARRTVQRAKGKAPSVPTKPDDGWETWAAELYRTNLKEAAAWAEDPDLPIDALHALAVTPDPKARKTKKNPHPPAPKEIRKALARNPACPAEVLDAVLIYDISTARRRGGWRGIASSRGSPTANPSAAWMPPPSARFRPRHSIPLHYGTVIHSSVLCATLWSPRRRCAVRAISRSCGGVRRMAAGGIGSRWR